MQNYLADPDLELSAGGGGEGGSGERGELDHRLVNQKLLSEAFKWAIFIRQILTDDQENEIQLAKYSRFVNQYQEKFCRQKLCLGRCVLVNDT